MDDSTTCAARPAVLVAGCAGFIGRHVCRAAAARGFQVIGLGHMRQDGPGSIPGIDRWRTGDVTADAIDLTAGGTRLHAIINCAGAAAHDAPGSRADAETAAEIARHAGRHAVPPAVVHLSSGAIYGHSRTIPAPADAPATPVTPHGARKTAAEATLRQAAASHGIPVAIVRAFSIYGEGQRKQLPWDACRKALAGETRFLGTGAETRDWVHVADLAELLLLAIGHAAPDAPAVNGATGIETRQAEFVGAIFDLLAPGTQPVFHGAAANDFPRYAGDPAAAAAWGWRAVIPWREGIAAYARWAAAAMESG